MFVDARISLWGIKKEILLQSSGRQKKKSLISVQNQSDEANDMGGYREIRDWKGYKGAQWKIY